MKKVNICDITMKQSAEDFSLSFKEKIELAKLLDRLGVSVIELEEIQNARLDGLRIKSIATAVTDSIVAVPVQLTEESVRDTWNALQLARHPRLQVCASVSPVQMEYLFHKKPDAMVEAIRSTVSLCAELCDDVEFIAQDATRSEPAMLQNAIAAAMEAGAGTITVCDTAGTMLPEEFGEFIHILYKHIPELKCVNLGVCCANSLSLADACCIAAMGQGATEIKAAAYPLNTANLANMARVLDAKKDCFDVENSMQVTQLSRAMEQVGRICQPGRSKASPFHNGLQEDSGNFLTVHDDMGAVIKAAERLGYDLSEEDSAKVYEAFRNIASKRDKVSDKELDAIVASAAMQVPPTYILDSYVINSGNTISATAHLKLHKKDSVLEGVSVGDGPIDAAFLAIEQITGRHYELDDFQIQSVTEGREAMGPTVVKLRSGGRVHSGRGISTDIVGASIRAYISALNKIVYEEEEV